MNIFSIINGIGLVTRVFARLSRELPQIIEDNVESFCKKLLGKAELANKDYNQMIWGVHPERKKARNMKQGENEWGLILAFGPGVTFEGIAARNLDV
ncbi:unnamed protein product [Cochlearia groenlandica]